VFRGHKANDTVLWVESQRALISGDTLVDFGRGPFS
jgi:glyoxylase-like metal-dependent hydrolase (beta-lactamase superfamily II)